MTRPTSRLEWFGNDLDHLGIGAIWIGSGWDYTLYWGHLNPDGTPAKTYRSAFQGPARHTYPQPGEYTLLAVSELNKVQVSEKVVVRGERSPQATLDDLGGGRVRLNLKGWPVATWHRVIWNVGETPEDFTGSQLHPEHQYPPGTDKPLITVIDVPARRLTTLVGPGGGDPPPPPSDGLEFGWNKSETWWSDKEATPRTLRVWGLRPGAKVRAIQHWHSLESQVLTATADRHGLAVFTIGFWWPDQANQQPQWKTVTVTELTEDGTPGRVLHCPYRMWMPDGVVPIYDFDDADPQKITLRELWTPQKGTYQVDWGDGTAVQAVVSDGVAPWRATHRYSSRRPVTITVTAPDGQVGTRKLAPLKITDILAWRYSITTDRGTVCPYYEDMADEYTPIRLFADDVLGVVQNYTACPGKTPWNHPCSFMREVAANRAGQSYHAWAISAFTDRFATTVTIPAERKFREVGLRAGWKLTTPWDGGYSGEFTVTNSGRTTVAEWGVEFRLAAPALITDVWPQGVGLTALGDNRYVLTSGTNLGPDAATTIGLRVERAGAPRAEPKAVGAFPFVPR